MKNLKKILAIAISLLIALSMTAVITIIPGASAHNPPWTVQQYCYCIVAPNVIGVGQTDFIAFWSNFVPPTAVGETGDRWTFIVTITASDGTNTTLGPITSDPVGTGNTAFTPDQAGNYTITATVKQHTISNEPNGPALGWGPSSTGYATIGDIYTAATSIPVTLVVQSTPIPNWPDAPLPTDYWSNPINDQNRDWWTISGNWLETNGFNSAAEGYYYKGGGYNPYTAGPTSAHILWAQPEPSAFGGVMGGVVSENGGVGNYYTGMSYEQTWGMNYGPWIISGMLYFDNPTFAAPNYGCYCYDLATGKLVWQQNFTITAAQVQQYVSPNQFGGIPYLWNMQGSTWSMYNAANGNFIESFKGCTSGTTVTSPTDGSILVYIMGGSGAGRWLAMWNSSLAVWANTPNLYVSNTYLEWRPYSGATGLNWSLGIQWNVTEPAITGTQSITKVDVVDSSNMVLCTVQFAQNDGTTMPELMAYSASNGALLWGPENTTAVPGTFGSTAESGITGISDGVVVEYVGPTMSFYGYNAATGAKMWGPTLASPTVNGWAEYGFYRCNWVGQGCIYLPGMDGYVHCLNITTGQWLWDFDTGPSGLETTWGNWPLLTATFLGSKDAPGTNGLQIYAVGGHTHLQPMYRGAQLYDVNGTTGQLIWSLEGWWEAGAPAGADGMMVAINGYDNQLYGFGKGNTQTTVNAPMNGVIDGNKFVISGTVTDQSPGQTGIGVPTAGTPAVSDASMSSWMTYLYMDQPKPTNTTGVPVTINAIDPNGNLIQLGTTTSDGYTGYYSLAVNPSTLGAGSGQYTVLANFGGSNSYYSSSSESSFILNAASATASPAPLEAQQPTGMYIIVGVAAIIIAIVIGFAITILMLRKRP